MADAKSIKKGFDIADVEKVGYIKTSELENALRIANLEPKENDMAEVIQELGNPEFIDFKQFGQIVEKLDKLDQANELKDAFRLFAPKGFDYISPDTLREIVKPILDVDITEKELDQIISDADLDGDGQIDIEEFVAFMMKE